MSTHKWIDRICICAVVLSLVLTALFVNGEALGINKSEAVLGYEPRIFDTSKVHSIALVVDDWENFLEECENEEYVNCTAVIDGESYKNIGLRAKGNTSLSNVKQMNSQRYSMKLEFDHYQSGNTYHGLDKLCLNNLIQDNTMMKDYLTYRMMADFGVDAPLCSYAYVTVNGEDWGLFLAVEGLEDGFMQRAYAGSGDLYKPDSTGFGGGRGNGKDFDFEEFFGDVSDGNADGDSGQSYGEQAQGGFGRERNGGEQAQGGFGGGQGGMGSDDVKLKYVDDDPDSYSNIFDNAKTDVTTADQKRLIAALKKLGAYEDLENTLDIDKVLRYFVVHNFVVNGDSYTGSMIHNYYLHEEDGQLAMIPWDYNLAYGSFQGNNASSAVNDPIDSPLSVSGDGDRPMADWIFSSEEYTKAYHQYFAEFLESNTLESMVGEAAELIDSYVEKDPTKFCTYEEFQAGVEAMKQFCELRTGSVKGQLDGTIPSTDDGQSADSTALIDTGDLNISDLGSMGNGGGRGGNMGGMSGGFGQDANGGDSQQNNADGGGQSRGSRGGHRGGQMQGGVPGSFGQDVSGGNWMSGGMSGGFGQDVSGGNMMPGSFGDGMQGDSLSGSSVSAEDWILLGVSAAVLLAGIFAAMQYRRKR